MGIRNERVVYAVYDYDAQSSDEMSFKDGDRVTILRRGDDQEVDWVVGSIREWDRRIRSSKPFWPLSTG